MANNSKYADFALFFDIFVFLKEADMTQRRWTIIFCYNHSGLE
jgi:hypothetical protein